MDICSYIQRDSPQNAATVAQRIIDAIDSLEILPHRYKVHEHRKDAALTVHSMPEPPYIVYYRVDDPRQVVRIIHVRDGRRHQPRRIR